MSAVMGYFELPWKPLYMQQREYFSAAAAGEDIAVDGGAAGEDTVDGGAVDAGGAAASSSPMEVYTALSYWSLAATVAFTVAVYWFELKLDMRQRAAYKQTQFPLQLQLTVAAIDQERQVASLKEEEAKKKEEETKKADDGSKKDEDSKNDDDGKEKEKDDDEADKRKKKEVDDKAPLLPQLKSKFDKAQAYGLDKMNFGMIASTYDTFESVAFLLAGLLPWSWDLACRWGLGRNWTETDDEIKISLVFLAIVTVIGTVTSLPFELYSTFEIERKHGFNKQTIALFVTDKIKGLALTAVIGGPFTALLLYIIKRGGPYFYLYVWVFMICFSVFMMTIVPVFIMPLFNKYEPLQDGSLKRRIFDLAESLKYPLTKLFVMDGSKRSAHSNAFLFGFGNNKRIVLFDTLLSQVREDEILAILGHELGHWKLGHTVTNFCVTQLYFGAAFYFFSVTYGAADLYAAFGFNDPDRPAPTVICLLLFFQTLWAPVDKALSFLLTCFSRRCEFQADSFSCGLGMSAKLQSGLCKIHLENLGAMCPDPLYSMYHYSHPPLVERLAALMELDKKKA